ncbi:MAG: N-acetylglucosamine-specific PTS transporter subunit IIBC [Bacillota bacterium]|nr:N-acetylglucosamine-specific PTS transporter subunit IIBC [Bacillota bacterium]
MKFLQKLGKALMQAVAVLPVAALLIGFGYLLDPAGWGVNNPVAAVLIKSGQAVLDNLGLIFATAVAYGLTREQNGAAALSGLVGFMTVRALLDPKTVTDLRGGIAPLAQEGFAKADNANVFIGILVGILAAFVYQRFYNKKLPDALAFFSGRRLVPILTSLLSIALAGILYFVWPLLYNGLVQFGNFIIGMGSVGAGIYAFFNRLLIPTGLHHALNAVFWFDIADINDIPNFLRGAKSLAEGTAVLGRTGMYQAGFFPIMMFGLPGAALAMYHTARSDRKKVTASLLLAASVAAFVTGVTEPLEFAFMFVAPFLYLIHAILTGISVFIAAQMQWIAGFGFSAGAIDLFLSTANPLAPNWYMLIPQGLFFFSVYYVIFRFCIVKFRLKTPGREDELEEGEAQMFSSNTDHMMMAAQIVAGLGGAMNIEEIDYCSTRLRITVADHEIVREAEIKKAKVAGLIRPAQKAVQVIIGPQVQFVYDEIQKMFK